MDTTNTRENGPKVGEYGRNDIDYSDVEYRISLDALIKIITSLVGTEQIIIKRTSNTSADMVLIEVKGGSQPGGLFFDLIDKTAYGLTKNWSNYIDKVIAKKVSKQKAEEHLFDEASYCFDKGLDDTEKYFRETQATLP